MSALWIARRILSAQRKLNVIVPTYYLLEVTAKNKPVFLYCCVQLGASHMGQKGLEELRSSCLLLYVSEVLADKANT